MFGFGLGKLLVLVAVVAAVWYGFKLVTRLERERKRRVGEQNRQPTDFVEEMEKCRVCGAYVAASGAQNCGRRGCPY